MPLNVSSKYFFLLVFLSIIVLALVVYGAKGVRGSDQYWYVTDVIKLVENEPLVTNNYFPGVMLREGAIPVENHIMHNSPMLHIVGLFATSDTVYRSWISLNVFFHYTVAACIFFLALRFTSESTATAVTALYLVSPIGIWQTINPLLEMYFSVLVALQVFCYFYRDKFILRFLLYPLSLLGVVSHPIFIIPAVLWGAVSLIEKSYLRVSVRGIEGLVYFVLLAIVLRFTKVWFPSSFQPDLKSIIASVVPGVSNMFWHYSDVLPVIDSALLLAKAKAAIVKHLLMPQYAPLYFVTNVSILGALYLVVCHFKRWWHVLLLVGLFGGQYLGLILLQQNHPRFQQIVIVVIYLLLAVLLHQITSRYVAIRWWTKRLILAGVLGSLVISTIMVRSARQESFDEHAQLSALEEKMKIIPAVSRVVGINLMPHNPFSVIAKPRDILFIRTDMLSEKSVSDAIAIFQPDYFIVHDAKLKIKGELVDQWNSEFFGNMAVYKAD